MIGVDAEISFFVAASIALHAERLIAVFVAVSGCDSYSDDLRRSYDKIVASMGSDFPSLRLS